MRDNFISIKKIWTFYYNSRFKFLSWIKSHIIINNGKFNEFAYSITIEIYKRYIWENLI